MGNTALALKEMRTHHCCQHPSPVEKRKKEQQIGCAHNAERRIIFGTQTGRSRKGKITYRGGDTIKFRCPKGCADLVFLITSQRPEAGQSELE